MDASRADRDRNRNEEQLRAFADARSTSIRKFAEAGLVKVQYINPTQIDVTLSTVANMHGMMIKASNPDGTSDVYFSYQRTYATLPLSSDPVLAISMPLAPPVSVNTATVATPAPAIGTTFGVALTNIGTADATATVELLDANGITVTTNVMSVAASHYTVRSLDELFPGSSGAAVRVTSTVPVEVLGVAANQTNGTAMPVIAQ